MNEYIIKEDHVILLVPYRHDNIIVECIIDKDDLPRLIKLDKNWNAWKDHKRNVFYARTKMYFSIKGEQVSLHRWLLRVAHSSSIDGVYKVVDHINHNTLDNRKSNLRLVSNSENMLNTRGLRSTNKSGYNNVYWHNGDKKWRARTIINEKRVHLGSFIDKMAAIEAVEKFKLTGERSLQRKMKTKY